MIRPFHARDLPDVLAAWYGASRLAHPFLSEEFLATERTLIAEEWLPASETIVFEHDGVVVGFLSMTGHDVGGFFVHPDHHGAGVGRALMDHVRDRHPFLELEVFEANPIGRRFYDAYGFTQVSREVDDETGQPVLRLRLGDTGAVHPSRRVDVRPDRPAGPRG